MFGTDEFFKKQNMGLLCKDDTCSVYQIRNKTGDGIVSFYSIYPGISVLYNDFHMSECPPRCFEKSHLINIHHCLEGRVESEVVDGSYIYLSSGDTMIENFSMEHRYCSFPFSHFHGVVVTISVEEAIADMGDFLTLFEIDFKLFEEFFTEHKRPVILHGNDELNHIFSDLYHVPDEIKKEYLRIKVLELLLILKTIDINKAEVKRPYFYKTQVEKIKAIRNLIIANPEHHYTIENLALRFDISVSSLKSCFKGVYDTAIYTYMRNYRMNMAATLLTQSNESIAEIAGKVGYSNSSKFSRAFKAVKGVTPIEYRKIKI